MYLLMHKLVFCLVDTSSETYFEIMKQVIDICNLLERRVRRLSGVTSVVYQLG